MEENLVRGIFSLKQIKNSNWMVTHLKQFLILHVHVVMNHYQQIRSLSIPIHNGVKYYGVSESNINNVTEQIQVQ